MSADSISGRLRRLASTVRHQNPWGRAGPAMDATADFMDAVQKDHAQACGYRSHYHGADVRAGGIAKALVEQIGFQMMTAVRVMQWARNAEFPLGARVCSRLIRHLYGAEVHWDTVLEPGVCIVHGVGLVLGHDARVDAGCILFHNVTLGEGLHPDTRDAGTPHLERNVHVGPGCTLLGPITVGEGSKLMAGCVVNRSVPPFSVVTPAAVDVARRKKSGASSHRPQHV